MDEEVQFVMSQIDLSSEKGVKDKEKKNRDPNLQVQTPPNISPQRSKFLFQTSIHSSNSKEQIGLAGKAGIRASGETKRSTRLTGLSTPWSARSSRRKKGHQSPDKSPIGEYDAWKYAALRPGTSSSPSLDFTSDGDGPLSSPEQKGAPAAKTSFMSKKRGLTPSYHDNKPAFKPEKSKELCLI
jgi:hypothetical protein